MDVQEGRAERSRDLERFLTFVDAIAAVAITLLVLPLVDLGTEIHSDGQSVSHLLTTHANQFWSFALSFVVIARLWLAQHVLLRSVIASSRALTITLLVWAMAIVFLPFPTALLPEGGSQAITKVLYLGTLTISSVCLMIVALIIRNNRELRDTDRRPRVEPAATTAVVFVLALTISLIIPATSYYPLLLLPVSEPAVALISRLTHRHS
jgi:uncharacterized membrane protein